MSEPKTLGEIEIRHDQLYVPISKKTTAALIVSIALFAVCVFMALNYVNQHPKTAIAILGGSLLPPIIVLAVRHYLKKKYLFVKTRLKQMEAELVKKYKQMDSALFHRIKALPVPKGLSKYTFGDWLREQKTLPPFEIKTLLEFQLWYSQILMPNVELLNKTKKEENPEEYRRLKQLTLFLRIHDRMSLALVSYMNSTGSIEKFAINELCDEYIIAQDSPD